MEKLDRLDKYLLNPEADKDFKEIIDADAALATEYKLRKQLMDEFEEAEVLELRDRLDVIHTKIEAPQQRNNGRRYGLIALILAILVIGAIFISKLTKPEVDVPTLYATNFTPLTLESNERNSTEEGDIKELATAYARENYTDAIVHLDKLLLEGDQPKWRLYKVVSLMQLNQFQSASEELKRIIDSGDIIYRDQAIWYQALIALKQGQIELAKSKLNILSSDPDADYHNEAKKLLSEL